jgi:hypothetical protein
VRYLLEEVNFDQPTQYNLPDSLRTTPLSQIDMDTSLFARMHYSLDEFADRIGYEVAPTAVQKYRLKPTSAYGY